MKLLKKISVPLIALTIVMVVFSVGVPVFAQFQPPTLLPAEDVNIGSRSDACIGIASMIRSGNIHLRNIPCFIKFFTQTVIGLAGSLAVVFVMIGGYQYVVAPDDQKDQAKKTITYALIGLAVSLLAFIITDLVLQLATE